MTDEGALLQHDRAMAYGVVSKALTALTDEELIALLDAAPVVATGIGGTGVSLSVAGHPVFAKRVPLTDLEREPVRVGSTENMFALPGYFHYGIGSAGGGVWRELAAHKLTTQWVLSGECTNFPLMYHSRVLPRPRACLTATQQADLAESVEQRVIFWGGSASVRQRLTEIASASADVVIFCEFLPMRLGDWLSSRQALGAGVFDDACRTTEGALRATARFLSDHGFVHFDAHFDNVLTDGSALYVTDFGLATSRSFQLSLEEQCFLENHRLHDECYVATSLVNWLLAACLGVTSHDDRVRVLRPLVGGDRLNGLPDAAADIIYRCASVAIVMNEFYGELGSVSRAVRFPTERIAVAVRASGFA